ncbi:unnamed protein product [Sympodiomycopsis kandeliae]
MTRHLNTVTWYTQTIAVIVLFFLLSCRGADANLDAPRSLFSRTSSSDAGSSTSSHHSTGSHGDLLVSNPRPHSPTTGLLVHHATEKPASSSSLHPAPSSQAHSAHPPEHLPAHTTHPASSARPSEDKTHTASSRHPPEENVQRLGKAQVGATSTLEEGSKRPRRWWNTPGGAPPRQRGTSPGYLRQQRYRMKKQLVKAGLPVPLQPGYVPRLPAGTGARYEQGVRWRAKAKQKKLAAQKGQTQDHSVHRPPSPHGGGPGSPGAGSHAVSKRRLYRN